MNFDVLMQIRYYFSYNPDYKAKYNNAVTKIRPMITNCWFDPPKEKESEFRTFMETLPSQYTIDEFWDKAKEYKQYVSNPPTKYLLKFLTYPWDMDKNANYIYLSLEFCIKTLHLCQNHENTHQFLVSVFSLLYHQKALELLFKRLSLFVFGFIPIAPIYLNISTTHCLYILL